MSEHSAKRIRGRHPSDSVLIVLFWVAVAALTNVFVPQLEPSPRRTTCR